MMFNSSNGLRWKIRQWQPLLGLAGVFAIAMLIVCFAFYLSTIRPMQARLEVAQRKATSVSASEVNVSAKADGIGDTPSEQLAVFYQFFPDEKNSPQWLAQMIAVAEKSGLELNEGDYEITQDKVGKMMRYKITLPVQGTYPQIRKFLVSLNKEVPVMALEDVQFERKDVADSAVQAKIKLVLYLVQAS